MATTFTTLDYTFFSNGTSGASAIVGYADSVNRVVRYKFTTPDVGASKLSFSKVDITEYNNTIGDGENLYFYITDDPTGHANAGASAEYHGTVSVSNNTATGEVNITLLPNKDYYLFLFPGFASYGAYNWNYPAEITLTLEGGAGLMYIDSGAAMEAYQIFIEDGSNWYLYMPYVENGELWDLLT